MKKFITFVLILILTFAMLSVNIAAYDNNPAEEVSALQEEDFQEANDNALKNIFLIEGIAIGALVVILLIVILPPVIKRQMRKKKNAEIQARYDREKREMEEKEEDKLT